MTNSVETTGAIAQLSALVPTFQATIGGTPTTCCDARTLHGYLGSAYQFSDWIKARIDKYGFEQGQDFECVSEKTETQRTDGQRSVSVRTDYHLTLDMAKELSMVENNAKGREARRYFIACEKLAYQTQAPTAAPQPVPPSTAERLNGNDLQHIKRMIWMCTQGFFNKESLNQAIWFYLRRVLNWPSPQPWTVDHLPRLGEELTSVLAVCIQAQDLISHIERQLANRIFRDAADAQLVIAALNKEAETKFAAITADRAKLPNYLIKTDLPALISRKPAFVTWYCKDEQPDFFKA